MNAASGASTADAGFATVHPSSVLRSPSGERERNEQAFVSNLKKIAQYLHSHA